MYIYFLVHQRDGTSINAMRTGKGKREIATKLRRWCSLFGERMEEGTLASIGCNGKMDGGLLGCVTCSKLVRIRLVIY